MAAERTAPASSLRSNLSSQLPDDGYESWLTEAPTPPEVDVGHGGQTAAQGSHRLSPLTLEAMLSSEDLIEFVEHEMRMSHVHQPLLIRWHRLGARRRSASWQWPSSLRMRVRFATTRIASRRCHSAS